MTVSVRQSARQARAGARSGSGPVGSEQPTSRWPGASQKFALFGEVLATGIIVTVVSLPLITLPVALAAGHRHLLRYLRAERSTLALVWADLRAGIGGGLALGAAWLVVAGILLGDLVLVRTASLPGATGVAAVTVAALAVSAVLLLRVTAAWAPATGWRTAIRSGLRTLAGDPTGSLYLLVAVGLAVLATWMLIPLVVPALGCVCFAVVAIAARALPESE